MQDMSVTGRIWKLIYKKLIAVLEVFSTFLFFAAPSFFIQFKLNLILIERHFVLDKILKLLLEKLRAVSQNIDSNAALLFFIQFK